MRQLGAFDGQFSGKRGMAQKPKARPWGGRDRECESHCPENCPGGRSPSSTLGTPMKPRRVRSRGQLRP